MVLTLTQAARALRGAIPAALDSIKRGGGLVLRLLEPQGTRHHGGDSAADARELMGNPRGRSSVGGERVPSAREANLSVPVYSTERELVRRVAVMAYHSSPLVEPGAGDAGGMTVYVRQIAASHAALGVSTDIFTRAATGRPGVTSVADGVRVVSIEAGPNRALPKEVLPTFLDDFVAGVDAFASVQSAGYDVLHSHYWQSGVAGIPLRHMWGVPLVHSQHTLGRVKNLSLTPDERPEPQARIDGEERVIANADLLLASTDEEWEQLSCLYGASHDRIEVVRPGVDHDMFRPGASAPARKKLGIAGDQAVLLCVGRILPLKGIDLAIRTTATLIPLADRDVHLLIVGGAAGATGARELARLQGLTDELGVGEHVHFLGPRPHADLPDLYRAADVLLVCSRSESFGLAALEAHACGLPVVATAVGGLINVVRDAESGWLLRDGDAAAFAAHLQSLLADPGLRRSFSVAAVRSAMSFSWRRTADELLELYERLVATPAEQAWSC